MIPFLPSRRRVSGAGLLFGLWGFLATDRLEAASLVRGPVLQLQTTNSVVVHWQTDEPAQGVVFYGESVDRLDQRATVMDPGTDQQVPVTGLHPGVRYYYAVGERKDGRDLLLQGVSARRYFQAAPRGDSSGAIRIWVLGDSATAAGQAAGVRDGFKLFNNDQPLAALLLLSTEKDRCGLLDVYRDSLANTVVWPVRERGDDLTGVPAGECDGILTLPVHPLHPGFSSGTNAFYSFDAGNVHFVGLDSAGSDRHPGGPMLTWLEKDLAATRRYWIVAFLHDSPYALARAAADHPANDGGLSQELREMVLPVLEAGGVDVVLSGHGASYQRSYLIDGHYGEPGTLRPFMILDHSDGREEGGGPYRKWEATRSPHRGTVYVSAGGSGRTVKPGGADGGMAATRDEPGSLVLEFGGRRLDADYVDDRGRSRDHFSIIKGHR